MQTAPPPLTDRRALELRRARARRAPAFFLRQAVATEVEERLAAVNRRFRAPAIVTPFAEVWAAILPGARTVPDSEILSLVPGAHDLVIHDLCLHWANDPVGQLVQCRHALVPDGLLIATLFAGRTLHELRAALATAEAELTGGLSPRVLPMGEIRDLGALLQRAGLALPVADATVLPVSYADPLALLHDLRAMGESNALAARLRRPTGRAVLARALALYAARHALPDGRIPATFEVVTLTGWAPGPGQPKPLRPGSAAFRLAEALGTTETRIDPGAD
jgi:SAM-dependent methyltransferase